MGEEEEDGWEEEEVERQCKSWSWVCTLLGHQALGEAPGVAGSRQKAGCCCMLAQGEGDGGGLIEATFTRPSALSPPSEHRAS